LIINGKAQNTRNISDELFCLEGRYQRRGNEGISVISAVMEILFKKKLEGGGNLP
jgi:hypothetical protein